MNPILPEELTGLIDGELSSERASEVDRAIQTNPELRLAYEQLLRAHGRLTAYAQDATQPSPALAAPSAARGWELSLLVRCAGAVMLCVRIVCKTMPTSLSVGLGTLMLAIVAGGLTLWLIQKSDAEVRDHARPLLV